MKKRLPILKDQFINNWVYKTVALIVSLAIWLTTLHGFKDMILVRNMELEFILRPNLIIGESLNRHVAVKVSGPRAALKKFSQNSGTITLNLSAESAGRKRLELRSSDFNLPLGVKLQAIKPEVLEFTIREVKKEVR